jgi:glycyl-tRNA synthetase alpha chain
MSPTFSRRGVRPTVALARIRTACSSITYFRWCSSQLPTTCSRSTSTSLEACGIHPRQHDIRFADDNWESPTIGAWGVGWQVLFDGLEITQFTYFQQAGGVELVPVSAELTYGLERLAMVLHRVDNVYDLEWTSGVKYRDVRLREEIEQSRYVFNSALNMAPSALEHCLKCSHLFNILDASNSIGATERTAYILHVRQLAVGIAQAYIRDTTQAPIESLHS